MDKVKSAYIFSALIIALSAATALFLPENSDNSHLTWAKIGQMAAGIGLSLGIALFVLSLITHRMSWIVRRSQG